MVEDGPTFPAWRRDFSLSPLDLAPDGIEIAKPWVAIEAYLVGVLFFGLSRGYTYPQLPHFGLELMATGMWREEAMYHGIEVGMRKTLFPTSTEGIPPMNASGGSGSPRIKYVFPHKCFSSPRRNQVHARMPPYKT